MPVKNRFAEMLPEMTAWRQDFHANPELLFDVHRTAARVAALCRDFGCDEVVEGIGRTGVVVVIRGKTDTQGRVIGLRADMDALPIHEQTGVAYASTVSGKMHACGHDGHTSMLLGAAKYLAETRNFDGTAVMIFQPAEEGGGGGREMCAEGLMARWGIQEVYGMHNMPGIPVGHFAIRPGAMMAAADTFEIVVTGKGGHAAKPHDCVDTVVVASHIILALQTIASRNVDPLKQVVVSVCVVSTDSTAHNVIPQVVRLKGTVRTMDGGVQDLVERRLCEIAEGTAMALGARAVVDYQRGYPVTVNAEANTTYAADVARAVSGVVETNTPPLMGAEDFSFMLNERPGAYIFVGNGDTAMVHHPAYNFDDEVIPFGASWYVGMVEARMPAARSVQGDATSFVLLSAVRNEGPDLLEWIAYHRVIGFDQIVIYSNDCTDGSDLLLDALAAIGWITHHRHVRGAEAAPQEAVAAMAIKDPVVRGAKWVLWLDADEFLVVPSGQGRVSDLVAAIGPADGLAINWRNFGDNGQTHTTNGLVLERFTMAAGKKKRMSRTVKTLFRMTKDVQSLYIHRPVWREGKVSLLAGDGKPLGDDFVFGVKENARPDEMVPKERLSYRMAQINHYAIKALDRVAVKQTRGSGMMAGTGRFGLHYLKRFNNNDEEDLKIQRHLPELREMMATALADPQVAQAHAQCEALFAATIAQVMSATLTLERERMGQTAEVEPD